MLLHSGHSLLSTWRQFSHKACKRIFQKSMHNILGHLWICSNSSTCKKVLVTWSQSPKKKSWDEWQTAYSYTAQGGDNFPCCTVKTRRCLVTGDNSHCHKVSLHDKPVTVFCDNKLAPTCTGGCRCGPYYSLSWIEVCHSTYFLIHYERL